MNDYANKEQKYKQSIDNLSNLCRDYTPEEFNRIYEEELHKHNNKNSNQSIFNDEEDVLHYKGKQPYFNENGNMWEESLDTSDVEWMENEYEDSLDSSDVDWIENENVINVNNNYSQESSFTYSQSKDEDKSSGFAFFWTIVMVIIIFSLLVSCS